MISRNDSIHEGIEKLAGYYVQQAAKKGIALKAARAKLQDSRSGLKGLLPNTFNPKRVRLERKVNSLNSLFRKRAKFGREGLRYREKITRTNREGRLK